MPRFFPLLPAATSLTLLTSLPSPALAATAPCETPPPQAAVRLGYERGPAEPFRGDPGTVALRRTHASVDTGPAATGIRTRVSHDYSAYAVDLDTSAPQPSSNGHVHRLAVDADVSGLLPEGWQLRVQPALAVSSNQLKSPGDIQPRGLQLNGALLRHLATDANSGWDVGLCADQRFGEYRLYPAVSWQRQAPGWFVQLGWPDTRLVTQLHPVLQASLQVAPGGDRWHVYGQQDHHWFSHEAWQARLAIEWRPWPALGLELSTSRLFDNRLSFELEDGTKFTERTEAPQQWGLALTWYFGPANP